MPAQKGNEYIQDIILGREVVKHNTHIRTTLKTHGKEVKTALIKLTSTGTRSGRVYSYRGRKYRASAPGEAPAKRSGRLSSSFRYQSRPLQLTIGNTAKSETGFNYARFLEEEMDRPYFLVTINSFNERLNNNLQSLR